jgi:hypothetical protein
MCWIDKNSVIQILKLKKEYNMDTFVETGTFKGVNTRFYSYYWENVLSCDIFEEYLSMAKNYNKDRNNVFIEKKSSGIFIKNFIKKYKEDNRNDIIFFFLDAHFYDPSLPKNKRWVIVDELKSLKGFKNCVLCLHDFDCSGLGHLCYDGQPLGFPLVVPYLNKINKDFYMYVNTKETCDVHNENTIKDVKEIIVDEEVLDNIKYANSCDRLTYRGILYCVPYELNLDNFELKRA